MSCRLHALFMSFIIAFSMPAIGTENIVKGKWIYSRDSSGSKLGWSSGATKDELEGVVFLCSKRGAQIEVSIDLNREYRTGQSVYVFMRGSYRSFQYGGTAEEGLNGPNVTVTPTGPSVLALLKEHSYISVKIPPSIDEIFPADVSTFEKFTRSCEK